MIKGSNPDNTRFLLFSACAIFVFFNPARFQKRCRFSFFVSTFFKTCSSFLFLIILGVTTRVGLFVSSPRLIPLSLHLSVGFSLLSLTRTFYNSTLFSFNRISTNPIFISFNGINSVAKKHIVPTELVLR